MHPQVCINCILILILNSVVTGHLEVVGDGGLLVEAEVAGSDHEDLLGGLGRGHAVPPAAHCHMEN